jgi:ATP-binding cassette subfamily F protein 3
LVDKVYEFGNQSVKEHLGGIYEFLERKKIENLNELEKICHPALDRHPRPTCHPALDAGSPDSRRGLRVKPAMTEVSGTSYEQRKEQQRQLRRLEKSVADYETKIEKLETDIRSMEEILITPEGASNVDLLWKHAELQKKISDTMNEWTEATIELENFNKSSHQQIITSTN